MVIFLYEKVLVFLPIIKFITSISVVSLVFANYYYSRNLIGYCSFIVVPSSGFFVLGIYSQEQVFDINIFLSLWFLLALHCNLLIITGKVSYEPTSILKYCGIIFIIELLIFDIQWFSWFPSFSDMSLHTVLLLCFLSTIVYLVVILQVLNTIKSKIKAYIFTKKLSLNKKKLLLAKIYYKNGKLIEDSWLPKLISGIILVPMAITSYIFAYISPLVIGIFYISCFSGGTFEFVGFSYVYIFILSLVVSNPGYQEKTKKKYGRLFFKAILWNVVEKVAEAAVKLSVAVGGISAVNELASLKVGNIIHEDKYKSWKVGEARGYENAASNGVPYVPQPAPIRADSNVNLVKDGAGLIKDVLGLGGSEKAIPKGPDTSGSTGGLKSIKPPK